MAHTTEQRSETGKRVALMRRCWVCKKKIKDHTVTQTQVCRSTPTIKDIYGELHSRAQIAQIFKKTEDLVDVEKKLQAFEGTLDRQTVPKFSRHDERIPLTEEQYERVRAARRNFVDSLEIAQVLGILLIEVNAAFQSATFTGYMSRRGNMRKPRRDSSRGL